jgi:hypothetical protein
LKTFKVNNNNKKGFNSPQQVKYLKNYIVLFFVTYNGSQKNPEKDGKDYISWNSVVSHFLLNLFLIAGRSKKNNFDQSHKI